MKKHHTSFVLLVLFFTALIVYQWAEKAEWQEPGDSHLVLPRLNKTDGKTIQRVVIERPKDPLVFQRRAGNDWQMKEPVDVAANSAMVSTLVTNLRELRRSSEAGTIQGSDAAFGFAPPAATVRFYSDDSNTPLVALEIGGEVKGFQNQRYVRAVGGKGIDVVDSGMLKQTALAAIDWREQNVFDMPTFYVGAMTVTGPGRDLHLKREDQHWEIERPVRAPADDEKAEGVAAELSSLRVAEGKNGFYKDNVTDFTPYGLDKPTMTITLQDRRPGTTPQVLDVGSPVPDKPELRYARRQDQDDVVLINAKEIHDLGRKPNALRSQKVADINAARATFLTLASGGRTFKLAQTTSGWFVLEPKREKADAMAVATFLNRLGQLQTSDFLEPGQILEPNVDPPIMTVKLWQAAAGDKLPAEAPDAPTGAPRVNLRIGRQDPARKTLYGQIEGDKYILALPEAFRDALPKNSLAFRDRAIQAFSPTRVSRVVIRRDHTNYDLTAPDTPGQTLHWRMTQPVEAAADDEQATKVVMLLGNLRAADLITERPLDDSVYGLDHPVVTASWTLRPEESKGKEAAAAPMEGTLRIGASLPGTQFRYATIDGTKLIFTLGHEVVDVFLGEFRDHRVLSFVPSMVARIVFRWPDRLLSFVPHSQGPVQLPEWRPEPGVDPTGFDFTKINALLDGLSRLQTDRYVQYRGIFPESFGLTPPRLSIELQFDNAKPKTLRVGNQAADGPLFATAESHSAGAVFTVAGPAWVELAKPPRRPGDLPEQVFHPSEKGSKP